MRISKKTIKVVSPSFLLLRSDVQGNMKLSATLANLSGADLERP